MMVSVGTLTKQSSGLSYSSKGEKRKPSGQTTAQETNPVGSNTEKPKKAPLKAELIIQLKNLEKEYEALKLENMNNLKTIQELENKVATLEEQATENCSSSGKDQEAELDMSFGPRYCKKCGFEAEDGYQLDGHVWSEHEDTESNSLQCQHCDENFSTLKDLMIHKKGKHVEKVSICWNFSNDTCPFGDTTCWFRHEIHKENDSQSEMKYFKCNICGKMLSSKTEFMKHKKNNHEEHIKTCNLFKRGQCTYHESCWFAHKNIEIDEKINNRRYMIEKS